MHRLDAEFALTCKHQSTMDIEFEAPFGNEIRKIKLTSNDYGGNYWQIYINKYYHGQMYYRDGMWRAWLNEMSELTTDDITVAGERIDTSVNKKTLV